MTKKPQTSKDAADNVVKNIRRKTRQTYSSKEEEVFEMSLSEIAAIIVTDFVPERGV